MGIVFRHRGNFNHTERFFNKVAKREYLNSLATQAQRGVDALRNNTPTDSGLTANSWEYTIEMSSDRTSIIWSNMNVNKGVNIAIILQYGHGTGTGGYVAGRDYINPALRSVFDDISNEVWRVVTSY